MNRPLVALFTVITITAMVSSGPACTVVAVGRDASLDGSVIVSHTDTGPNSRIHVVHGSQHEPGAMAPVYWGIQDPSFPLGEPGEIIGHIPQVEQTYTYFHSAYPHINKHQLAIGESTTSQRAELVAQRSDEEQGSIEQIENLLCGSH